MSLSDASRLHGALSNLHRRALADHRLHAELQRARREFFGVDGSVAVRASAELRFVEWALLERESLALAAVPVEVLSAPGDDDSIRASAVGVYRIETVDGERCEARDLQDDDTVDLVAPEGALVAGDLMVGRIYPSSRGVWQPSPAIAIYRPGKAIAEAFQRDLKRLELDRRLTQIEVERLLLQQQMHDHELKPMGGLVAQPAMPRPQHRQVEHIEAELESVMAQGGAPGLTTHVSDSLAQAARAGVVVGPLLEKLAFDTSVDLDRVRRLLLELWNAHHADEAQEETEPATATEATEATPAEVPGETLGQKLARVLDEGLSQKRDVEELFRQLEEMAGIEGDEEDEDDDALAEAGRAILDAAESADVDGGDLAPLVTEHIWETQQAGTPAEATLQMWVGLQQNAAIPHTSIDDVTDTDVMRLFLHVYLKSDPRGRANAVRSAHAAVESFSRWAEETQELSLASALAGCKGTLLDHLDRLQELGIALSSTPIAGASTPGLLRVEDVGSDGFGVRGDEGSHWILATKESASLVRIGDLLLGSLAQKGKGFALSGPVVALPSDAESLIG